MTAKQLFRLIITTSLVFPPILFIAWDENLDPPFIANAVYDFLTHTLLPALSVVLSIAAGMYGYKKYNECRTFKANFKDYVGPVYLSRLNLQQCVWHLGKAEPM
ncbi:hypothetical protein [uncultured Pseudoalteromonas sp.]|uniref:hypothetical protein n=1 Tax=uncultured Pseudoalteromonas sp. TaxID=114053 RepID=UPI0030C894E2